MTMTAGSTAGGAVYDRGYRPYQGPVGGRWAARWAVFRLTARRALGIRRSWRQRVLPWSLLALATVPAIVNVGIKFATRDTPADDVDIEFITYHDYVEVSMILLLFIAVTAPDAICPDRRNQVLPLVFSRPLTGADYVLAKLGAMAALVFGFAFFPQVVLFIGQTFVHEDGALDYIGENAEVLWQVPLAVAVLAVYLAAIGVALSSLTTRRIVGGVAILGLALVSGAVAGLLVFSTTDRHRVDDAGIDDRGTAYEHREMPAPGPGGPGEPFEPGPSNPDEYESLDPSERDEREQALEHALEDALEEGPDDRGRVYPPGYEVEVDAEDLERFEEELEDDPEDDPNYEEGAAFSLIDVFNVPLFLRDVIFLGHIDPLSELGGVAGGAVMALAVYLVVVALSLAVLLWRYREVQL